MEIKMDGNDKITLATDENKLTVYTDYRGLMTVKAEEKSKSIPDLLFEERLKELIAKESDGRHFKDHVVQMEKFILEFVPRASKALSVDKNKMFGLLLDSCNYSTTNFFQPHNFYDFKSADEFRAKIDELHKRIREMETLHKKEMVEIQKKLTEARSICVEKKEVETDINYSWDAHVNCPYCDDWQEVEDFSPEGSGKHDHNQECGRCGKYFSVVVNC